MNTARSVPGGRWPCSEEQSSSRVVAGFATAALAVLRETRRPQDALTAAGGIVVAAIAGPAQLA